MTYNEIMVKQNGISTNCSWLNYKRGKLRLQIPVKYFSVSLACVWILRSYVLYALWHSNVVFQSKLTATCFQINICMEAQSCRTDIKISTLHGRWGWNGVKLFIPASKNSLYMNRAVKTKMKRVLLYCDISFKVCHRHFITNSNNCVNMWKKRSSLIIKSI